MMPIPPQNRPRRVAVLVSSTNAWGRQVLRGIATFAQEHGGWDVFSDSQELADSPIYGSAHRWDGIIARLAKVAVKRRVLRLGVPVVNVSSVDLPGAPVPTVRVDDWKLGVTAAQHLLAGGFRHLAYFHDPVEGRKEGRGSALAATAAEKGVRCTYFSAPRSRSAARRTPLHLLIRWVKSLPKPVGIFAWNAAMAQEIVEACRRAAVAIPDQAAVLAGDDDRLICELSSPTISAVVNPAERIGYEAARHMEMLMSGGQPAQHPILIEPAGIIRVRQSSDISDVQDRNVHLAVQMIQDNAQNPWRVRQVAASLGVSRRSLERAFRRILGRTPHDEIFAVRLERAKRLLLETDLSTSQVARAAGFASVRHLHMVFRRQLNMTPRQYRLRFRLSGAAGETFG